MVAFRAKGLVAYNGEGGGLQNGRGGGMCRSTVTKSGAEKVLAMLKGAQQVL